MSASADTPKSSWPPPPGTPPEISPPWMPPERPVPPPGYPPVPVVFDAPAPRDDLAVRLLERRIVMVSGPLDLTRANEAAARLMLLDGCGDDPIQLVLSCPDGDLIAATALADTVVLVGVELRTVASGVVGGPVVLPFALGTRRLAQPHATFRFIEPALDVQGRADDLALATARHRDLFAELHHRVAAATGQSVERIAGDFRSGRLMNADEATAYGLVDEIIRRQGPRTA
jgi:ATP-dependent Clp protease, protease subunit